ncbi:MAG TPA: DUF1501 domain-containing protein [Chloroflexota bacterium]|nr:DUF1501 domain-containing protein [Chloroflexota bacterium]
MKKPPTLVVLQLTGGNDALNTVIPHGNSLYWENRPTLAIPEDQILRIDNQYGFHPSMAALKPFWDRGKMAVIMGVGYEDPSYSHFRSADIWYTAEPTKIVTDGWLGKVVRELDPKAENVVTAVNFGRGLPRALSLAGVPVGSVARLDTYGLLTRLASPSQRQSAIELFSCLYDDGFDDKGHLPVKPLDPHAAALRYMGQTGLDAKKGAEILSTVLGGYRSTVEYPKTPLAASLKGIAQVKLGDVGTRVFYTSISGFDTHAGQGPIHAALWTELSEAVAAFFGDLREHDADDDVIMLLWTEFGRRVHDNVGGTDHGAAGAAFVIGEPVKGGIYGEYPSLREADLTDGNLAHTVDFRSAYTSVIERWLQVDAKPIVNGRFEDLAFV